MPTPSKRASYATRKTLFQETPHGQHAYGVEFAFKDGGPPIVTQDGDYNAEIVARLTWHGAKQKIADSWVKASSAAEARAMCLATIGHLKEGTFSPKAGAPGISDDWIIAAIAERKEKTIDEISVVWKDLPDDARDTIRKDQRTRAIAERLRAEAKEAAVKPADDEADLLSSF